LVIDLLRSGYSVRFRVDGRSMLPALTPGSLVLVQPLTGGLLSIGEIVLCNLAGRLIAHRIVGTCTDQTGKRMLLTRGDNQSACDLPVDFGSVLGRVSALEGAWRGGLRQIGAALARLVEGRGTGA
jgi:hypothetical protein